MGIYTHRCIYLTVNMVLWPQNLVLKIKITGKLDWSITSSHNRQDIHHKNNASVNIITSMIAILIVVAIASICNPILGPNIPT